MFYLFVFLLLLSIFLEGIVTALPLVFVCLICLTILRRDAFIFLLAFVSGILLDVFALRTLGETSIFLLISVFLILLYQRKYEINTYPFVLISSFVGSFLFLVIFGFNGAVIEASISALIAALLFTCIRLLTKEKASRGKMHYI